mmetsp:Transcript_35856/g.42820  ORF Transcript_35856/g.42820 Transcript_35856/m.42820 type:complete len:130 (-) Transcript_35856:114-503(-)|eukprot:CAMPEP_0198254466 /NCGR_PEP_ID=MMETSP1447-20131203/4758_1 /TAXON_ID=420782 /ORGANISM="Chaetoceros dichaeta, Strain CCMP1751" /LENGTH=129 /DNA_ID=CAMNT_0043940517 /DNA_START=166 /DNA_END=555 /DNA_ORIENTATION=-
MPFSDPQYPVINPSPNVDNCLKSMRFQDYIVLAGSTAATWGYGYLLGKPLRGATASTAAALGMTFAGMFVLQDTRARLMGFKENAEEVKAYGLYEHQPVKVVHKDRRFPVACGSVSASVKPVPRFDNYN